HLRQRDVQEDDVRPVGLEALDGGYARLVLRDLVAILEDRLHEHAIVGVVFDDGDLVTHPGIPFSIDSSSAIAFAKAISSSGSNAATGPGSSLAAARSISAARLRTRSAPRLAALDLRECAPISASRMSSSRTPVRICSTRRPAFLMNRRIIWATRGSPPHSRSRSRAWGSIVGATLMSAPASVMGGCVTLRTSFRRPLPLQRGARRAPPPRRQRVDTPTIPPPAPWRRPRRARGCSRRPRLHPPRAPRASPVR